MTKPPEEPERRPPSDLKIFGILIGAFVAAIGLMNRSRVR